MSLTQRLHCSFAESVQARALAEQPAAGTVFVFPAEISKKQAQRLFQKQWRGTDTLFLTMEEFKELCFPSAVPLLKEEKRTLAFYESLQPAMRRRFRIQNYFQSIEWAHHFFSFWEECNEENIAEETVIGTLHQSGCELQDWQKELFMDLVAIKEQYGDFVHRRGYEDILFSRRSETTDWSAFADYDRFVFVNQYYYTATEKALIAQLDRASRTTVIYYQMPARFISWPEMEPQPFSLSQLQPEQNRQLRIREAKNVFSMMAALADDTADDSDLVIIDPNPQMNPYYRFFALDRLRLHMSVPFQQTTLYRFFTHLYHLLDGLMHDPDDHLLLLPLQAIMDVVTDSDFYGYFSPDQQLSHRNAFCEQGCLSLYDLVEQDFKYVDLEGRLFHMPHPAVKAATPYLAPLLELMMNVTGVRSMAGLLDVIDQPAGVNVKSIINEHERSYSDILDVFYQTLADFAALDSVGLVDDWSECLNGEVSASEAMKSKSWLRFFLEYLKPQRIHFSTRELRGPRVEITNLLDTRNLDYRHVAVINMAEGVMPRAPQTPFLFNESQRRLLGLKTYDQVRLREKYYFTRLLCTTPFVDLYSIKNTERDVEVSSFVEEVRLSWSAHHLEFQELSDRQYPSVYARLLAQPARHLPTPLSPAFFAMPFDRRLDLAAERQTLSFYQYQSLREQPFIYYIRHLLRIQPRNTDVEMNFTPLLLGRLAHELLNTMWYLFMQDTTGLPDQLSWPHIYQRYAEQAYHRVLNTEQFARYRIPKNYTRTYFEQVQWPMLQRGMRYFFTYLAQDLKLDPGQTRVYPEASFSSRLESDGRPFVTVEFAAAPLAIHLAGRADLRLEAQTPECKLIFDYKTGSIDATQLLFYEWLYYRSGQNTSAAVIQSYGCDLIKARIQELEQLTFRRGKPVRKDDLLLDLAENIQTMFSLLAQTGYDIHEKKFIPNEWQNILRQDLLREYGREQKDE